MREKALFVGLASLLWWLSSPGGSKNTFEDRVTLEFAFSLAGIDTSFESQVSIRYKSDKPLTVKNKWILQLENLVEQDFILLSAHSREIEKNADLPIKILAFETDTLWLNWNTAREVPLIVRLNTENMGRDFRIVHEEWSPKTLDCGHMMADDEVELILEAEKPTKHFQEVKKLYSKNGLFAKKEITVAYHAEINAFTTHIKTFELEKGVIKELHIVAEVGHEPKVEDFKWEVRYSLGKAPYYQAVILNKKIASAKFIDPWK